MATKEELQAQADAEIEAAKPMYKQVNNERMEFSDSDYDQAKIDLSNSKWDAQQFGYIPVSYTHLTLPTKRIV